MQPTGNQLNVNIKFPLNSKLIVKLNKTSKEIQQS